MASPTFGRLQLAGWASYAVLMILTFLPMADTEGGVVMLVHLKLVHAALGPGSGSRLRVWVWVRV